VSANSCSPWGGRLSVGGELAAGPVAEQVPDERDRARVHGGGAGGGEDAPFGHESAGRGGAL
jgi:hypothetical protein